MNINDLVFENKLSVRILRHLLFWLARIVFYYLWYLGIYFMETSGNTKTGNVNLIMDVRLLLFFVFTDILFTYVTVYFFQPVFLAKKKYLKFFLLILIFVLITFFVRSFFIVWFTGALHSGRNIITYIVWMEAITFFNIGGPFIICLVFASIKMLKVWYAKEEQKFMLVKENSESELRLLKAQVHPHFLFNTLNNIYSYTISKSPHAGDLILKLKDTLKYMTDDCETALVPLEKELKMIQDYIGLEKVRYSKRLEIEMVLKGSQKNKFISPLLIIPFVENCFKHGTSQMLGYPWIRLHIYIKNNSLFMYLSNSKIKIAAEPNKNSGIGLKNIRKRLMLLYPGNYHLAVSDNDDFYQVRLQLPLEEIN